MMEVENAENSGEKEKDRVTTKEEPMEAEPIKEEASVGELPTEVKQEPGAEEADDDPVIHEIPVYLSKSIPKLYLFQVRIIKLHIFALGWSSLNN